MSAHQNPVTTTDAGLLLSLAAALPDPRSALGRAAVRLAAAIDRAPSRRDLHRAAADLTARLLDATDPADPWDLTDPDILDPDFDA